MIKYLFEDSREQKIPKFYMQSFPKHIQKLIEYSDGAGNLESYAKTILKDSEVDFLYIFVDFVPNNYETADTFSSLCTFAMKDDVLGRVFIIPTLGMEYYFIKSLDGKGLDKNTEISQIFLELKPYADTEWNKHFKMKENQKFRTFEKFGKLLVSNNYKGCVKGGNKADYTRLDCICELHLNTCKTKETVQEKSEQMTGLYNIIPSGRISGSSTKIGLTQAADIVEDYIKYIKEKANEQPEALVYGVASFQLAENKFKQLRECLKC